MEEGVERGKENRRRKIELPEVLSGGTQHTCNYIASGKWRRENQDLKASLDYGRSRPKTTTKEHVEVG